MEVTKYGPGGVAQQIVVTGELGSVTVDTENKIRTALGGNGYTIEKQDGTVIDSMALLPSAFLLWSIRTAIMYWTAVGSDMASE